MAWLWFVGCAGPSAADRDGVDLDHDGVGAERDCDDGDGAVHPGAAERCDGLDTNCDGVVEPFVTRFDDRDGDGWGSAAPVIVCDEVQSGLVANNLDCDDLDPARHPSADEPPCVGFDANCDGEVVAPGSVSVTGVGSFFSLSSALAAMPDGGEVVLCPGDYAGSFDVSRSGTIRSLGTAEDTVLTGSRSYPVITVLPGLEVTVERLALTSAGPGYSATAGGVWVQAEAEVVLRDVVVSGFDARTGGAWVDGALTAERTLVTDNSGVYGGIAVFGGVLELIDTEIGYNDGPGIYLWNSTARLTRSEVVGNDAVNGGGLIAQNSQVSMDSGSAITANEGRYGGGTWLDDSSISGGAIVGNHARTGGGVYVASGPSFLDGVHIEANDAVDGGGLMVLDDLVSSGVALVGNTAVHGAAAEVWNTTVEWGPADEVFGNAASQAGGGVRLMTGGGLVSSGASWSGNTPDDVWIDGSGVSFDAAGATPFACLAGGDCAF